MKRRNPNSTEWARLEADSSATFSTVGQFVEALASERDEGFYLFDWSLPLHCPELDRHFK